ncbi:hypothetical protein BS50DRAFT_570225 [Corynespora cassiicola Philippines]|uniref:Uncharacterized protein n=1 Tax=Corynespora cassiicola Philippines TaxID=1448308 RepID=A0A2T2NZ58_CORCC|nr:hypothetical protein BS50DRAFT_570225 [Corynespora cassiicola Philippines]
MTTHGTAPSIIWPAKYLPGTTDNFVSNEAIALSVSATKIWSYLVNPTKWPTYYSNASQITPPDDSDTHDLIRSTKFSFSTFGFPPLACECTESVPPAANGQVGRLAWRAWQDSDKEEERLEVYHAWLIEDLEDGRVRVLTQESQIGVPARQLAETRPDPMLNGHQQWLDGLIKVARGGDNDD